jgi:hypothetical protein
MVEVRRSHLADRALGASLGDIVDLITGIATAAIAITAVATVLAGLSTYIAQGRERRGRWLADLQQRFASEPVFQSVRRELYNGDESELAKTLGRKRALRDDHIAVALNPLTDQERHLLVALDDYLDFFGLLERLIREKELGERDAYVLFSWYVLSGVEIEAVTKEISANFEWVVALRERFKRIYRDEHNEDWAPPDGNGENPPTPRGTCGRRRKAA